MITTQCENFMAKDFVFNPQWTFKVGAWHF